MRKTSLVIGVFLLALAVGSAVESGRYRLLSASESTKLILVSKIPDKTKYVLDASTAKITRNDKPAEFTDLRVYTVVTVTFELKKSSKNGIDVDGVASEIKISSSPLEPLTPTGKPATREPEMAACRNL
jgi:hypothetical protein